MVFLETARLRLRNVEPKDADVMFDYRNNEICARYQRGQTRDRAGIVDLVGRRQHDVLSLEKPFMLCAARKDTDEMLGEIVVMPNEETVSLGYTFSYRIHRQGFAYEALSALIPLLHGMAPEWEFISFTDPKNEPSIRLLEKLGYRKLGYIPSTDSFAFGQWVKDSTAEEIAALSAQLSK